MAQREEYRGDFIAGNGRNPEENRNVVSGWGAVWLDDSWRKRGAAAARAHQAGRFDHRNHSAAETGSGGSIRVRKLYAITVKRRNEEASCGRTPAVHGSWDSFFRRPFPAA